MLALALLSILACLLPSTARAQAKRCSITGVASLNFGVVREGGGDAQTRLNFECQSDVVNPYNFRVCAFVGEGTPTGLMPRRMVNSNGAYMNYDLYSDAARTIRVGPVGNTPVYSPVFPVQSSSPVSGYLTLYGRVPAGQNLPAASPSYQGLPAGSVLRYSYALGFQPTEEQCRNGTPGEFGGSGEMAYAWSGVTATYIPTCRIVIATDADFGTATTLPANRDQTSTIQLQCATNAPWRVGLDNGANASGTIRRMASGGNRIIYELYRNSGRTQRWGNTSTTDVTGTGNNTVQTLTVYGRVPAQATPAPGSYADTITVTLTY